MASMGSDDYTVGVMAMHAYGLHMMASMGSDD